MTTGNDRVLSFLVMRGVSIYGGFAGDESALSDRNVVAYPVILSGDIGETDIAGDNSYHVISVAGITDTLRLDGLAITGGYADGDGYDRGGGIRTRASNLAPVILENTLLSGNAGLAAGTIFNESELRLIGSTLDQAEAPGMGHIVVLNTGPLARLILADTTIIQHGTATSEGVRSLEGAELRVTEDSAIEWEEE